MSCWLNYIQSIQERAIGCTLSEIFLRVANESVGDSLRTHIDQQLRGGHLQVRILRPGHCDWKGTSGEPERSLGQPRSEQREHTVLHDISSHISHKQKLYSTVCAASFIQADMIDSHEPNAEAMKSWSCACFYKVHALHSSSCHITAQCVGRTQKLISLSSSTYCSSNIRHDWDCSSNIRHDWVGPLVDSGRTNVTMFETLDSLSWGYWQNYQQYSISSVAIRTFRYLQLQFSCRVSQQPPSSHHKQLCLCLDPALMNDEC